MADKRVEKFRKAQDALVAQDKRDERAGLRKPSEEWHRLNKVADEAYRAVPWWKR